MKHMTKQRNTGAVSIFIVLFTTILITVATISFIRIMVADQEQATLADVSQSAYDSSLAGVEDAKRMMVRQRALCQSGSEDCTGISQVISSGSCQTLSNPTFGVSQSASNGEVLVQQTSTQDENEMHQAYTCVKMNPNLKDYLGELQSEESVVIPIKLRSTFTSLTFRWYDSTDLRDSNNSTLSYPAVAKNTLNLPTVDKWTPTTQNASANTPPIMRLLAIQPKTPGTLSDFYSAPGANTGFLYPSASNDPLAETSYAMNMAARFNKGAISVNMPKRIKCQDSLASGGYACSATITLDSRVGDLLYLHLTSLYGASHYSIEFNGDGDGVHAVTPQVEVDSTGRANNLFRRVLARLELTGNMEYPSAALSVKGDLCKDFAVSQTLYKDNGCYTAPSDITNQDGSGIVNEQNP